LFLPVMLAPPTMIEGAPRRRRLRAAAPMCVSTSRPGVEGRVRRITTARQ
jgi:hypothetical protein